MPSQSIPVVRSPDGPGWVDRHIRQHLNASTIIFGHEHDAAAFVLLITVIVAVDNAQALPAPERSPGRRRRRSNPVRLGRGSCIP